TAGLFCVGPGGVFFGGGLVEGNDSICPLVALARRGVGVFLRVLIRGGGVLPIQGKSASRNSPARWKRISGFLASIRVNNTANVAGTDGLIAHTGLGGSQRCRSIFCKALPPENGGLPVRAKYIVQPNE